VVIASADRPFNGEAHRVVLRHVERVVTATHDALRTRLPGEQLQLIAVMGDGVEEQLLEPVRRRPLGVDPDVGPVVPAVVPAAQQTGGAAPAVHEADPQQRQFLHDTAEQDGADRGRRLGGVSDQVGQVVL